MTSTNPIRTNEPGDRLGRTAAAMTDAAELHPEYHDGDQAIVMLVGDKAALCHLNGYDDDVDAMVDMFMHLRAIARANGKDIEYIGIPDDTSGLDR